MQKQTAHVILKMQIFWSFAFLLLSSHVYSQPYNHDNEIMQIKGKWTKHAEVVGLNDSSFSRKQYQFVFNKTDSIASLLKQSYPNPTGLEAIYYTSVGEWPVYQGAPASY